MDAAAADAATGALAGLRVLDLSRVLAGPWCSQTLGDLGAEVIKVERPGAGDDTRHWGPPFAPGQDGLPTQDAAYFLCANRNKASVAIDFSTPQGQALVRALAAKCDVLIENFKVGALAPYGLDAQALCAANPRLIYCSITGFGQDGPYASRPGYDFLVQGMGGLMSVTGRPDEEAGGGPIKVGVAVTDLLTGLNASTAILAAVQARHRTGRGQHIDIALLDVQVASLANQCMNHFYGGKVPGRMGNAHPNAVPYQDFPTADGHVILAIGNDQQFARFCQAAGHASWAQDPRFADNASRVANRQALIDNIRGVMAARSTADWIARLERAGVPCGPINSLADVFADPQVQARGLRVELPQAGGPALSLVASPLRLSDCPVTYRRAPPRLGQDSRDVLGRLLDIDDNAFESLVRDGIVG